MSRRTRRVRPLQRSMKQSVPIGLVSRVLAKFAMCRAIGLGSGAAACRLQALLWAALWLGAGVFVPAQAQSPLVLSEFMASNVHGLLDDFGNSEDWIEVANTGSTNVLLYGWSLTDSSSDQFKWTFPATNLPAGGHLVVFASNRDRRVLGRPLHTNFKLDPDGEYLALVGPDGVVATEFAPAFPPQVTDVSFGAGVDLSRYIAQQRYFMTPTPGQMNSQGVKDLGPVLTFPGYSPALPGIQDPLTITCRVQRAFAPITKVTLVWRVMFGATNSAPMFDDGLHGDGVAGDGVYGSSIPKTAYGAGQMVRWYLSAVDSLSRTSRWPMFQSPTESAEFLGTVIQANYVTSNLPVVHLFAPADVLQPGPSTGQIGADSESGGRVSLYYDGEFYDNIYMELRGNTTAWYSKKSHRLEFNAEHKFRHAGGGVRLRKTSFTADHPDPTFMRQGLAFWLCAESGAPGPFYEPYRLQLNGSFYQLANHNDVHGEELLERLGYDPNGALYNAAGTLSGLSTGGFDKKTRTWDSNADYNALMAAISGSLTTSQRTTNLFEFFDLPEIISYMVAARFVHENDDVWANMSVYHDNDGDGLWRIIPFDMNLSFGAAFVDSGALIGIQATNDTLKSHPLYGSSRALWTPGGNWNRMYDAVFRVPQTREMFLRRMRTFLDTWVKPPGTPATERPIEVKVLAWRDRIAAEANRDRSWWGWAPDGGQNNLYADLGIADGVNDMLTNFVAARRLHFYGKHSVTNTGLPIGIANDNNAGIPLAQPTNAVVSIIGWDFNPVSGNQDEEFIVLTNANSYAVDVSGWTLGGGVSHTLQKGTVLPSGGALYLTPSARAFRNRSVGPRGKMGLFVQGGYKGRMNAWGESLTLTDPAGRLVSSNSFAGSPSLAQQFLRVTEIMHHPAPAPGIVADPQTLEFIELRNTSTSLTLDLRGCRFTNGISFQFTGSAVTNLGPGQSVVVVRDPAAFAARYGSGIRIAGTFAGALDSGGETLRLEDAAGEKILEFRYDASWYPITDGLGFSLVIADDRAPWSTWSERTSWRVGGRLGGTPGQPDASGPVIAPIVVNEVLAHTDPPLSDAVELFNPTSSEVDMGGWFLTDDYFNPRKYRIPAGTSIGAGGYRVFEAAQFNSGSNPFLFSEYGESAYVFSGDATTNLTGYSHGWTFHASPNGVSIGLQIDSQTNSHVELQRTRTLGAPNDLPRVGPVVISEIMYHPVDGSGGVDNDWDEFIELQNITLATVPLYCAYTNEPGYGLAALTNTWQLRNAVDFDFPAGLTLPAGARLLVVGFDPTNGTQLTAFRSLYQVPADVAILGPWSGKLDNSAEQIELKYPDRPDTAGQVFVPYVMVEQLNYRHEAPWPFQADGTGHSLQRIRTTSYGNDPINWLAAAPSAGQTNARNPDGDADGMLDAWESAHGLDPEVNDAGLDPDGDGMSNLQEFLAGTDPQRSASVLALQVVGLEEGLLGLQFEARSNLTYTLQSRSSFDTATWQALLHIPSAPSNRIVNLPGAPVGQRAQFYRVVTPATP